MSELCGIRIESVAGVPLENVYHCLALLVRKRGIRLLDSASMPEVLGKVPLGVCLCQDGELCIGIRDGLSVDQRAYVLAHELGHFMLHRDEKVWPRILFDGEYYEKMEREAHTFTSKLISLISLRLSKTGGLCRHEKV